MAKLSRANSKMLLVAAVFISLSGLVATIEAHKCYWCGPLADQVHRSRRSQPCNSTTYEETTCDPGYEHCAVIATSPPLTESRVCVKVYQDECYSVYCNSSRHWRVVCPCRGQLCNGVLTQRETDAFTTLFQKTKRSTHGPKKVRPKRALLPSSSIISARRSKPSNFISARRPKMEANNDVETSTINNIVNSSTTEEEMQSDQPVKIVNNDVQSTSNSDGITKVPEDSPANIDTTDIQQYVIKTTPQNMETKLASMPTADDEVTRTDVSTVIKNVKPSKATLTVEALQQNSNSDKQTTEIITTVPSTHSTIHMLTEEPNKNNTASIIHTQIFTSLIWIILPHYF